MPASARTVTVEPATRARWAAAQAPFELGLLLGQRSCSASASDGGIDVVLAAAPVPAEAESGETRGFEDVSPEWVRDCAQQVDRMLPGGISILGVYVCAAALPAASVFDKAGFYLRELATAAAPTVHYVAHVSGPGAPAFKSYTDAGNSAKTASAPAELVDVPGGVSLLRYHTMVAVSESVPFSLSAANSDAQTAAEEREAEIMAGLEDFTSRVRRGVCAFVEEENGSQLMKLLAPAPVVAAADALASKKLFGSVKGTIRAVAYVCSTEEEPEAAATEFLKSDLLKTLKLRVELARERWIDDADESGRTSFEVTGRVPLPKRNTIVWNYSGPSPAPGLFDLSFYTLPDDDESQAADSAFELLGGLAVKPEGATVSSLEGSWTIVEQDEGSRDEKIVAARTGDPDFAPLPYHYLLICFPVALALVFLLVLNSIKVERELMGYDDDDDGDF